jgi:hypothetical protein|tara:strand:- start:7656 stop:7829 length:174 start_codon:yes stop_codon:yes gene_type:complete
MYNTFEQLEGEVMKQAKTKGAQNLLKEVIENCKREKKTIRQTFCKINEIIVGNMGTC